MLKIRLRRMGSRHRPFYRVVVSDGRKVPTGSALEEIGYYDPRKKPAVLRVDLERAQHWLERGAQPSSTVRQLMRQVRNAAPADAATPADGATSETTTSEAATSEAATPEVEAAAETSEPASEPVEASAEASETPADADADAAEAAAEEAEGEDAETKGEA